MTRISHLLILAGVSVACTGALSAADAPNAADARMREALRSTMLQLRQAQTDLATAQAAQAEGDVKSKALTTQLEAVSKQLSADKEASDKVIAELRTKAEAREAEISRVNVALEKWKVSQQQAVLLASTTEAQRARLASETIVLKRQVADQQVRNAAMFKLGNEILKRYEKFGLGDALTAREPFVGITRVKFENLMQDYSDKLVDLKIKPSEGKPAEQKMASPSKPMEKHQGSSSDQAAAPSHRP